MAKDLYWELREKVLSLYLDLSIPKFVYFHTKEWVKGEIKTSVLLWSAISFMKNNAHCVSIQNKMKGIYKLTE